MKNVYIYQITLCSDYNFTTFLNSRCQSKRTSDIVYSGIHGLFCICGASHALNMDLNVPGNVEVCQSCTQNAENEKEKKKKVIFHGILKLKYVQKPFF